MKVILFEDVKSVGKKGDVVEVNDGYARNCILKKNLGVEATKKALNDLKLKNANDKKIAQEVLEQAQAFGKELEEKKIEVTLKTGKDGRSFGSVSAKEIVEAAKKQYGYELDKKKMHLPETIKTLGTYKVPIRLHQQVTVELTVHVSQK
ncbi:MAG: 50S ribosomal protein L9 [Lachnospiraceae bacterium]|nr:50S ribosomal protein L9 [Lachnospiraceae bacterium]